MFRKILCALGFHEWKHLFLSPYSLAPKYRYCPHCLRCEQNEWNTIACNWYRIEDIKDYSEIERLEKIYKNS